MRKTFTLIAALTLLTAALVTANVHSSTAAEKSAEKKEEKLLRKAAGKIAGSYIVVFNEWATGPTGEFSQAAEMADFMKTVYGGRVKHVYKHALNGFAAEMSDEQAARMQRIIDDLVAVARQAAREDDLDIVADAAIGLLEQLADRPHEDRAHSTSGFKTNSII